MGEQSYFHRKFYPNRFKRSKVSQPAPSKLGDASSRLSNGSQNQNQIKGQCEQAMLDPGGSSLVAPAGEDISVFRPEPVDDDELACLDREPETAEIRPDGGGSQHQTEDSNCRDQDCSNEPGPSKPRESNSRGEQAEPNKEACHSINDDQPTARSITPPNDHIETLNFHPDTQSAQTSDTSEIRRRHKESRLSKATRAILLFRRATSSLNNVNNNQNAQAAGHRSSRSFVAAFWRQNTADNSTCTRSSRMNSFASFGNNNNRSHHSLTAFLSGGGGSTTSATRESSSGVGVGTANQASNLASVSSSSSFSLPRFIVPKMNALKLPIVCLIKSLDDELMREIFIHRYELGQYLIDNLKVSLGMKDEKYFGLKMADSLEEQEDVRRPWLDLNESVYKQISKHGRLVTRTSDNNCQEAATSGDHSTASGAGTTKAINFYLRIKFYPPNLARVQDQFLKHYLWLQLRRDLRLGKLTSSMNNLTYLMACSLQYELGDYSNELVNERLPTMSILPNQDLIEQQAIDIWQHKLVGAKRHLVLMQFLRASVILETYGFDYYPVRDHQRQRAYLLGFNYAGVKTIRNGRIVNHFRWHNLSKISYERRMIIFHIYPNENSKRKQILGFKCLSNDECQNLYLRLLEQKYFFTVDLTYFDKSIRRPSHLTTDPSCSIGATGHQQQQLTGSSSLDQAGQLAAEFLGGDELDDIELVEDDDEEELEGSDESARPRPQSGSQRAEAATRAVPKTTPTTTTTSGPGQELDDELSRRRTNYHHRSDNKDSATSNKSTFESSLEWHHPHEQQTQSNKWRPGADHPAGSCSQASEPPTSCDYQPSSSTKRSPTAIIMTKSDSLQEPGQSDMIGCERSDCFSQPSSPSLQGLTCCATAQASGGPSTLASPPHHAMPPCFCCASPTPPQSSSSFAQHNLHEHSNSQHHPHQALLQRQCSFAKYSPDYEGHQHLGDESQYTYPQRANSPNGEEEAGVQMGAGMQAYQQRANNRATPAQFSQGDKRPPASSSVGQRLVDWTEQLLVRPAALFSRPDEWTAVGHPAASQQYQHQLQTQSGASNDVFMQGVRLCLLILLLNFMLRLSDGLSGVLIELLSFETHHGPSSPSATTTTAKLASMLDAPSES